MNHQSDEQLAQLVRDDRIDILVDLTGHIAGNRLLAFARKPAPIQVTYLGYQNTTGMSAMDYRLTDERADPPGLTDAFYTERLVRLPRCFFCYRPAGRARRVCRRCRRSSQRLHHVRLVQQLCQGNAASDRRLAVRFWPACPTRGCWSWPIRGGYLERHLTAHWRRARHRSASGSSCATSGRALTTCDCSHRLTSGWIRFPSTDTPRPAIRFGWACRS